MRRKLSTEERRIIEIQIHSMFEKAVTDDYARYMLEDEDECTGRTLMDDIIQNILDTSAWEDEGYYSTDDIRLAIGRELMARLGVDY